MAGSEVRRSDWVLAAALAVGVGLTFAPWLRSGSSQRTSYAVVRAADRLDVLGGNGGAVLRSGWSFLPLAAALGVLAVTVGWPRTAAGLAAVVGLAEGLLAFVVMRSPRSADWGALGGLAVGGALVVVALVTALRRRSNP